MTKKNLELLFLISAPSSNALNTSIATDKTEMLQTPIVMAQVLAPRRWLA